MRLGQHLKKLCESYGPAQTLQTLSEALKAGKINPYTVSIPALARDFLGDVSVDATRKMRAVAAGQAHLLESSEAVDASAFSNITGQLLVTIIKEKYEGPEFVASKMVKHYPNPGGNLKEHKIPYLSDVIDKPALLSQGEVYPQTTFKESWVTMPAPEKRGEICAVTMEMLYSDLTGQAQDSAASIGRVMAYQKEERLLKVVLGATNPYKFNDVTMSTYLSTANATGQYINRVAANTITNYTHVNTIEQLFWKMSDPITARRIFARPTAILCTPQKEYDLARVFNATEVRDATSSTHNVTPNPVKGKYPIYVSAIAQALLNDSTLFNLSDAEEKEYTVFADFNKAFGYREVYPMRTDVAPALNPMEFLQDIVLAVKVSEFGVPFVYDPRYAVLSTSEAS